jgi:cyclo(L-tyrosyl-L-tyrosyl) synthase
MRIGEYINTTEEEVQAKIFNVCFGFSLGNKYFTPDHIRSYLAWAVENTKDKIAVIIPDKIQAINYEVKNEYSPARALSVALRKGDEMEKIVRAAAEELRIPESKLKILRWGDIEDESYSRMLNIISTAFEENPRFRKTVIDMVKETPHFSGFNFSGEQYARLAQYIVNELPVLVSGLKVDGVRYDLFPYPGFANLDYLAIDLQEGTSFPEITAQLKSKDKLRLIELYVD